MSRKVLSARVTTYREVRPLKEKNEDNNKKKQVTAEDVPLSGENCIATPIEKKKSSSWRKRRVIKHTNKRLSDASSDTGTLSEGAIYTIDYSPRSKFLRKLNKCGRIVRKSPRKQETGTQTLRSKCCKHHKKKYEDLSNPPHKPKSKNNTETPSSSSPRRPKSSRHKEKETTTKEIDTNSEVAILCKSSDAAQCISKRNVGTNSIYTNRSSGVQTDRENNHRRSRDNHSSRTDRRVSSKDDCTLNKRTIGTETLNHGLMTKDTGTDAFQVKLLDKWTSTDSSTRQKTRDVGTDPLPKIHRRMKNRGTDVPSFAEEESQADSLDKESPRPRSQRPTVEVPLEAPLKIPLPRSRYFRRFPLGCDVLCALDRNERDGKETQDCPADVMRELREFREENWFDCHAAANTNSQLPNHKCSYKYTLSERELPVPVRADHKGSSLCCRCLLPASSSRPDARHELVESCAKDPSKKVTYEIPNPFASQPFMRPTVESTNKVSIRNVPTLSYVPHLAQRLGMPLTSQASKAGLKNLRENRSCYLGRPPSKGAR